VVRVAVRFRARHRRDRFRAVPPRVPFRRAGRAAALIRIVGRSEAKKLTPPAVRQTKAVHPARPDWISLQPFVYGVVGEARYFFNFDAFYDPAAASHRLIRIETNDLTSTGGLPHIGGVDLTHILRVPVMGPYLRASVFNEDTVARHATVEAYLTT
jgi:hypothetical protein